MSARVSRRAFLRAGLGTGLSRGPLSGAQDRRLAEIQEYLDARYAAQQRVRTPTPLPPLDYAAPAYRPRAP